MKMILTITLFISVLISQDVLTTNANKEYEGLLTEEDENYIWFKAKGKKVAQKMGKWTILQIKKKDGSLLDFSNITEMPLELMPKNLREKTLETRRIKREKERAKKIKEQCDSNRLLQIMVIPIKDDYYALTEEIETSLDSLCYQVQDNIKGLAFLDEKKISTNNINDFHLASIGQALELNLIYYGYTYKVEEPFNYSATGTATAPYVPFVRNNQTVWEDMIDAIILTGVSMSESEKRSQAKAQSGTYLGFTLFQIDISTGEKKILINNSRFRKL
ncbi:MAG: hypothetical protein CMG75_08865 [Candidatus Marinimicrobia bacterium]|nr:hypothetical protein [Candidatus Neomarinimicrobiota bacterium]